MTVKEYFLPESLDEAVTLLGECGPDLLVMAGGTIAMMRMNEGHLLPDQVMGLRRAGLDAITTNGKLSIGATTTLSTLANNETVPMLSQAARSAASWSLRNMATVGGNLFARNPYGDVATALLALNADLRVINRNGQRVLPLADFFAANRQLEPGELLAEILVSPPTGQTAYYKFGRRAYNTPAVITIAAHITRDGDSVTTASIALNGVAATPVRANLAESMLVGQPLNTETIAAAAQTAAETVNPPSDAVASGWYRQRMVSVILGRVLTQIMEQEQ
ncbi:MAG: FAD binding domain-containing protein [Anaerolineae bacterium]|nr:FAD binding domain-containing protein [Anaerolineae bacterium]